MNIDLTLLSRFWKQIAVSLAICFLAYSAYDYIWQKGYTVAHTECIEQFKEYNAGIDSKIDNLENLSSELIKTQEKNTQSVTKSLNNILEVSKQKQLITITKDGKCTLTSDFFDSYNSLILKGNQR